MNELINKPMVVAWLALVSLAACKWNDGGQHDSCQVSRRECQVRYSPGSGYGRFCGTSVVPCAPDPMQSGMPNQGSAGEESGQGGLSSIPESPSETGGDRGVAPLPDPERYSAFDFPCERDSQCGPGKCLDGDCYYGCQSDSQCGSGDRCAVESGTRICRPDPNPPVLCTRTAQCNGAAVCLNGSCRQTCTETEQCDNLLDRCAGGICQPDRRPLGQCVLNEECADGLVCLDGSCVAACASPDAGICLVPPRGNGELPLTPPIALVDASTSPVPVFDASSDAASSSAGPEPVTESPAEPGDVLDAGVPPLTEIR
jgi:hypothetical protein